MIKLPRLYVDGKFKQILHPSNVSITQTMIPLSTATMSLNTGEDLPVRSYVELFNPYGSAGMYRVRSPRSGYGVYGRQAELEHMISEVGDYLIKEEVSEMIAADAAMKRAFKFYKGGKWKLGSTAALGTGKIAYEAKYDRVLDTMLEILQQKPDCMMDFDFTTSPWTVNIVKKGTSIAEGRMARNVTSAEISYDDSELCTRCWYQVYDKNKNASWKYKDANVDRYGVVEGTVKTSADMTSEEINYIVDTYLKEHKTPRVSISVQGVDVCQVTGEDLDKVKPGKLYRLALPDYGLTVEDYVNSITWADVYGDPMNLQVEIGAEEDTVVTFLHNLDATGGGGGGGGKNKEKQEYEWGEYRSFWQKEDEFISQQVQKIDKQGKILEQAGILTTSGGNMLYALKGTVSSLITQQADRINLVVRGTGKNAKVNTAEIVAGINDQKGSYVKISAKTINLTGYTTLEKFTAVEGRLDKLMTGYAAATLIKTGSLYTNTLRVGGTSITKMSKYIPDVGFINYLGYTGAG